MTYPPLSDPLPDSPTRLLGATGFFPCEFWGTDFRESLPEDDPLREGFSNPPADGSEESVERLRKLHTVSLMATVVDQ